MRTKIYKLAGIACGLIALALSSCDLYREDYTEIYPEDYPKTENDLKLMVNALMYEFGTGYWNGEGIYGANYGGYQVMSDMTTDVLWSCWGWEADVLYVIGDAIDRGPDGIKILEYIKDHKNMDLLIGNHEFMMLNAVDPDGKEKCSGGDAEGHI